MPFTAHLGPGKSTMRECEALKHLGHAAFRIQKGDALGLQSKNMLKTSAHLLPPTKRRLTGVAHFRDVVGGLLRLRREVPPEPASRGRSAGRPYLHSGAAGGRAQARLGVVAGLSQQVPPWL
eukprot:5336473-Lingulodinium_polyedra.AAC.1